MKALDAGTINLASAQAVSGNTVLQAESGQLALGAGAVDLTGAIIISESDGSIAAGALRIADGADVTATGTLTASLENRGRLRVGNALGALNLTGDFTQTATGILFVQIGGLTVGTQFDQLRVTGHAEIDGTLNVGLLNGFRPVLGDRFEILAFDSRMCDFAQKAGLDLGSGLYLAAEYAANSMALVAGDTPDLGQQCQAFPEFTDVRVGPDPAKAGDPLSITFDATAGLAADPAVTVDGRAAAFVSHARTLYTYRYVVTGAETEGTVGVVIAGMNTDGQPGTATSLVTLDFTPPTVGDLITSPSSLQSGDTLTVTFTASEPLSPNSIVTVGGRAAHFVSAVGLDYTYARTITGGEGRGSVPVEIVALDLAGNSGAASGLVEITGGGLAVEAGSIDFSSDNPDVGDVITARVVVRNTATTAAENVEVRLTLFEPGGTGRVLATPTIALLAGGGQAVVEVRFDVRTAGVQVFEVRVDPRDRIPEDTEADNTAARALLVGDAEAAAISVTAQLSDAETLPGGRLTVTGTAVYSSSLDVLGPAAGSTVTVRIVGIDGEQVAVVDGDGQFRVELIAPAAAGNYVAEVRVSDGSASGAAVLPLSVLAPPSGVDLFIRPEWISASPVPVAGAPVHIAAQIQNIGADDHVGAADVSFYEGTTLLGTATLSSLAAGAAQTVGIAHTFSAAGPHAIRVVVDPIDRVTETREDNNLAQQTVAVLPAAADLTPHEIAFSDVTPSSLQSVTLTAAVRNAGGAAADDVLVHFLQNGTLIGMGTIARIAASGGVGSVSISHVLGSAGTHDIQVVVDSAGTVAESDETNNVRTETVTAHEPAPDLALSGIALSSEPPVVGEAVTVAFTVRNQGERAAGAFDVEFRQDGVVVGTRGDRLTWTIAGNTDPGLVGAAMDQGTLTLAFAADAHGTATITVRATDLEGVSARDYHRRIENLSEMEAGATFADRANGGYFLKLGETVVDDQDVSRDMITGASGDDWFFLWSPEDTATDLKDEYFADDLDWILQM